ncbi:hypothetical protein MMC09_005843 [Bachmanniomyces sp. S44760]|nr:hypothetical protein [Bachmanniomyces sp. S44760]
MILRRTYHPSPILSNPPPENSPRASSIFSDCDADDEGMMSAEDYEASKPPSETPSQESNPYAGSQFPARPSLHDVLTNISPSPWTLSAFTAYLSNNHCLETLEFTMDAERYKNAYDRVAADMAGMDSTPDMEECERLRRLWGRLMDAYILPNGPREVNLPSAIRDHLLSLPNHSAPPPPHELDAAVKIIYELMDESVLVPFLNEHQFGHKTKPSYTDGWNDSEENLPMRTGRAVSDDTPRHGRSRRRTSPAASSLDEALTPRGVPTSRTSNSSGLTAGMMRGWYSHASNGSTGSGDATLTDDSGSGSSPGMEPMTPPTTPPSSDIGGSPRSRASDNTWKKMMGRLGNKKTKSSSAVMRRIEDEGDY